MNTDPGSAAPLAALIRERLQPLAPLELDIEDDSARHAGHAQARGGGHFNVRIVSARFTGLGRVASHRLVYDLLSDLMPHRVHALSLVLQSPEASVPEVRRGPEEAESGRS